LCVWCFEHVGQRCEGVNAGGSVLLLDDVCWTLRGEEELTAGGDGSDLAETITTTPHHALIVGYNTPDKAF
jgi:hypothetical protein